MTTRAPLRTFILAVSTVAGVLCCLTVVSAMDHSSDSHRGWGDMLQGSGVVARETRQVGSFSSIRLRDSMDVDITIGAETQVVVEADDNLLPLIDTRVEGDELVIESHGSYSTHRSTKAYVQIPALTKVALDGSGDIRIDGLHQPQLTLDIAGSGDIHAAGQVDRLDAGIEGSGDLSLDGLAAADAKVRIEGSGDADVRASKSLVGVIDGSGDITYRGHPQQLARTVNGSGSIRSR